MAETHEEIIKVWIAPGCIVCDACETDCPPVFEVLEDTCIVRPDAQNAEFTKPLTPSIIVAAEGCPVEVIKYEVIEVEGPEPEAWSQEPEPAEAGAPGSRGGADRMVVVTGDPDPKWAGLLAHATASGRGEAGDRVHAQDYPRVAKVPPEAVVAALPYDAPPDTVSAAMVASGMVKPRPTMAQRIQSKGAALVSAAEMSRRQFTIALVVAWGALVGVAATAGGLLQSFMVPKATKEPPSKFRAGKLSDYPTDAVYEQFKGSRGIWIIRQKGVLFVLSTTCTHLGCIPNWWPNDKKFKCPCHGSGFYMSGINFEGPAPRPLERLAVSLDGETLVVDKAKKFRYELKQWVDPKSYIQVT